MRGQVVKVIVIIEVVVVVVLDILLEDRVVTLEEILLVDTPTWAII